MGVISWIVIGVIGGALACYLSRRLTSRDYLNNIAVGLVGAISGGFSANLVTRQPPLAINSSSLLVAVLGALVFLIFASEMNRSS
jgi:uncharacterized membrane protein YeaQ/YmgE (transglycosylase-associated protein family)